MGNKTRIPQWFRGLFHSRSEQSEAARRLQTAERVAHLLENLDHQDLADELRHREDRIALESHEEES